MRGNSLLVDGQPFVVGLENGVLTVDGIVYEVALDEKSAVVDGKEHRVEAAGMSSRAAAPKKKAPKRKVVSAGVGSVTAIMPGAILKVLVAQGDQVQDGDVVVILEAMKMENEIESPLSGKVNEIFVSEGENILENAVIMKIGG
ncbi:MAG: acetyl-CoA carboxylase biotin carboxyl carrier protein subunit [Candidatus Aegiribacteria sp.]|nr:acetyl-CoA carboxylase biotin carboxyl carrier protein subunit [Candidatus Aegiribacteria sp.]